MKILIQRVKNASCEVNGRITGKIDAGLLVFLGISEKDDGSEISWLVNKLLGLRIFEDENKKMNLSVQDINGGILLISQFTLYANCKRGRRPDFASAAKPDIAEKRYLDFAKEMEKSGTKPEMGIFGAYMNIDSIIDGPVSIVIMK